MNKPTLKTGRLMFQSIEPDRKGMIRLSGFDRKYDAHGLIIAGLDLIKYGRQALEYKEVLKTKPQNP